jgi:hypothetical protein
MGCGHLAWEPSQHSGIVAPHETSFNIWPVTVLFRTDRLTKRSDQNQKLALPLGNQLVRSAAGVPSHPVAGYVRKVRDR